MAESEKNWGKRGDIIKIHCGRLSKDYEEIKTLTDIIFFIFNQYI